jgi:pSer/pThr/pTyr-binding forkhead associated (FHA) protein
VPHLVAETGPLAGQRVEVARELTIGREGTDLEIDDPKISRHHATFRAVNGGLEVEDLGSTNGTFVGGHRIEGTAKLDNGASVRIGGCTFTAEVERVVQATQLEEIPMGGATQVETPQPSSDETVIQRTPPPAAPPPSEPVTAASPPATPAAEPVTAASPPSPPPPPPPAAEPVTAAAPPAPPPPAVPPPAAPAPAAPAVAAAAAVAPPARRPAFQAGQFTPAHARRGGLATRSWLPVALSYGTAVLVAVALVIYFASR